MFEEACLDPIKTMQKDILPRFLLSPVFRRMVEDVAMWEPPPPASDLKVPPPGRSKTPVSNTPVPNTPVRDTSVPTTFSPCHNPIEHK